MRIKKVIFIPFLIPLVVLFVDRTLGLLLFLLVLEKLFFVFPTFGIEFTTLPTLYIAIHYNLLYSFFFNLIFVPILAFIKSYFIEGNTEKLPFPEGGHIIDFLVATLAFYIKIFFPNPLTFFVGILVCLVFKHLLSYIKSKLVSSFINPYEIPINIFFNLIVFYLLFQLQLL